MSASALLQWLFILASLALQVLVIHSLLKGPYRQYPFAFTYSLVLFFTTVMDTARWHMGQLGRTLPQEFYQTETLRQIFLFAVVVSFIDRAMEKFPYRQRVRGVLVLVALGVANFSIVFHSGGSPGDVRISQLADIATRVARDLSFAAVILTLLLWSILLGRKSVDRQLLLATGGLGLQFTGDAIGQSLRQLAYPGRIRSLVLVANILIVLAHLMRLYVWWEAFRKAPAVIDVSVPEPVRSRAQRESRAT